MVTQHAFHVKYIKYNLHNTLLYTHLYTQAKLYKIEQQRTSFEFNKNLQFCCFVNGFVPAKIYASFFSILCKLDIFLFSEASNCENLFLKNKCRPHFLICIL